MSVGVRNDGRCVVWMRFDGDAWLQCLRPDGHDGDHEWQIPRIIAGDFEPLPRQPKVRGGGRPTSAAQPIPETVGSGRDESVRSAPGSPRGNPVAPWGYCENWCDITDDNPLLADGYCQGCHDYPEGS